VSLPIEVPTMHYQSEAGRPMMTKAYSSTSSSENAAGYLPTPSNPSRPSSPSLPYHISHPAYGTNRTSSNGSLPLYGSGINYSSTPELPIEMTPGLEKRSSYLSMNNIPSSPSPPIGQRDPPSFPSRHGQKTSPPIPPRHPSPAFNTKPPLPARPNKPSNNNFSFGPHQPSSAPYQHNGTYGGYNNNTGQMPTVGMPMPMPSPNHTYPEPPLTMPQPQQHYYHHQ
jgi:hypothetical protein